MAHSLVLTAVIAAALLASLGEAHRVEKDAQAQERPLQRGGFDTCQRNNNFFECPGHCLWFNGGCWNSPNINCGDIRNSSAAANTSFCMTLTVLKENPFNPSPSNKFENFERTSVHATGTELVSWPALYTGIPGTTLFSVKDGVTRDPTTGSLVYKPWDLCINYQAMASSCYVEFCVSMDAQGKITMKADGSSNVEAKTEIRSTNQWAPSQFYVASAAFFPK